MFTIVYHSIAWANKAKSQLKREREFPNRSKALEMEVRTRDNCERPWENCLYYWVAARTLCLYGCVHLDK